MKYNNSRHIAPDDSRFPPTTTFDYFGDTMVIITNDIHAKRMLKNFFVKNKKRHDFTLDFDIPSVLQ
jgi:excinuclease UvrABC helicase subunit UvrB